MKLKRRIELSEHLHQHNLIKNKEHYFRLIDGNELDKLEDSMDYLRQFQSLFDSDSTRYNDINKQIDIVRNKIGSLYEAG